VRAGGAWGRGGGPGVDDGWVVDVGGADDGWWVDERADERGDGVDGAGDNGLGGRVVRELGRQRD
jgi:hypothetical protein